MKVIDSFIINGKNLEKWRTSANDSDQATFKRACCVIFKKVQFNAASPVVMAPVFKSVPEHTGNDLSAVSISIIVTIITDRRQHVTQRSFPLTMSCETTR